MLVVMDHLRRTLGVTNMKAQCLSLLGKLVSLGGGAAAAINRRQQVAELDRQWRLEQQVHTLSVRQGWVIFRLGFAKLD